MFPLILTALLGTGAASAASASASSTLVNADGKHPADAAFDGVLGSGWGEGDMGYGEGEWLELDLGRTTDVGSVSIWPGNLSEGAKSFREFSRPRSLTVLVDGVALDTRLNLADEMQRVDVKLDRPARKIRVQVDEVYEGIVFSELFIAEMAIDFVEHAAYPLTDLESEATPPAELKRMRQYLESSDARRKREAYQDQLRAAYSAHKDAEFGDTESFEFIMAAAAEGPLFAHPKARSLVTLGYRAQAIRPDFDAVYALRKLKDPNGIPAIELTGLRSVGAQERELQTIVEIFYAYQDLIGGGNPNVGYWGESGWNLGALQGFDEPLPIKIDRYYNIYVADVGNNRIQRFSDDGRPDRQWGPPADITDAWFYKGRPWYVSGAAAGTDPGQFWNPVDVELIPGKEDDGFAAIDAKGRVQVFDAEGRLRISWKVETNNEAGPAVGGESYLLYVPKGEMLLAIIGNEAVAYTLDSEEVYRFDIEDGTPNGAVVWKNRVLLVFGREVIQYALDGFRHGTVIDQSILGQGFEDVALAVDEAGKLWALTDTGWAHKFKKPGKLDFRVRVSTRDLKGLRVGVREGIVYMTADDRIERIDVLQVKLDQEQYAGEEGAVPEGMEDLLDGLE